MIMAYRKWKPRIQCLRKFEYYIRPIKKWYFKQKCQASGKCVHFYALNTWFGLLSHELLHQCGVAWRDLDLQMNFHLERWVWTTDQQSSSSGKMLLRMFLFQKCLGNSFPEDVWAWWLLMHWLQLQFTPCEALPSVWIGFARQYSQACGHPCCFCTFSYPISSFQSTLDLICFDTALLEHPPPSFQ